MAGPPTATRDDSARAGPSNAHHNSDNLQLPPSHSSLSIRSNDSSAGYITASSSRVSQLDAEPLTALPRISFESLQSSTPKEHASFSKSPSSDSVTTIADSRDTSQPNLTSLSSVTTFVPSTIANLESDDDATADQGESAEEFVPDYEFDLRDAHERTLDRGRFDQDDTTDHDTTLREAHEGDVITVSHSHSTSINVDSSPHSRSASQPGTSTFPLSLSSSWPNLNLPPSAVKLHRKRRNTLLRLLKTWEGREQVLHLTHSLVLLLYSSLDHPVPQTVGGAIMRPAGTALAYTFPKAVRIALMQRIYTSAEAIDNFRRVVLIARWVTGATEAVMERWQRREGEGKSKGAEELEMELTGEEALAKETDREEGGFRWLQPPSVAPFDVEQGAEKSALDAPAAKLGKATGRGDATGAVGADVAEDADSETPTRSPRAARPSLSRICTNLLQLSHLSSLAESLATIGEACETAAVLAGGGMFWRAVGIQRLGLPLLSRRRRQGIERLGIVLSLCSVLLGLVVLRMERKQLRSELRSAHRRIIRANDKLGWATDLAGTTIERDQALSHRRRDPSTSRERHAPVETQLGKDLQDTARQLDDQQSSSDASDSWSVSDSRHSIKPVDMGEIVKSTERSLLRAESDLRRTRRYIKLNFWEKVANYSESLFLAYEAAAPSVDKDGVEGWTGLVASAIRLSSIWRQIGWGLI